MVKTRRTAQLLLIGAFGPLDRALRALVSINRAVPTGNLGGLRCAERAPRSPAQIDRSQPSAAPLFGRRTEARAHFHPIEPTQAAEEQSVVGNQFGGINPSV